MRTNGYILKSSNALTFIRTSKQKKIDLDLSPSRILSKSAKTNDKLRRKTRIQLKFEGKFLSKTFEPEFIS